MPQLGNDDFALAARRQATATGAYSGNRSRRKNLTQFATIAMVLLFTFIVRNILFTVSKAYIEHVVVANRSD
jgi:hypothetical protein